MFIYSFFWAIISTRFISNEVGVLVLHSGLTKLNQTTNWRVCISISVGPSSWGLRSMSKISTPKSWRYQGLEGLRWCQAMEFLEVSCYLQPFFQCWFCNLVFHVIEAWKFNLQLWVIWCSELQNLNSCLATVLEVHIETHTQLPSLPPLSTNTTSTVVYYFLKFQQDMYMG